MPDSWKGSPKSQSPLKAQGFKSQSSSMPTPSVKRTASWNLAGLVLRFFKNGQHLGVRSQVLATPPGLDCPICAIFARQRNPIPRTPIFLIFVTIDPGPRSSFSLTWTGARRGAGVATATRVWSSYAPNCFFIYCFITLKPRVE